MRCSILFRFGLALLLLVVLPGCPPRLQLVFDQGQLGFRGFVSDFGGDVVGPFQQIADDFELTEGLNSLKRIEWWGFRTGAAPASSDFTIRIFEDDGTGKPSASLLYGIPIGVGNRESTGLTAVGTFGSYLIYHYWAEFGEITLPPRTRYHLSIVNDTGDWSWLRRDDGAAAECHSRVGDSGAWEPAATDMAFQLWR